MALIQRDRLTSFVARLNEESGRVYSMQAQSTRQIIDDGTDEVVASRELPPENVDWAGLADIMHEDDIALLVAALSEGE